MRRFCLIIGLLVCGLLAGVARGDTFKLTNGQDLIGEALFSTANDQGMQIKVGEGEFKQVTWGSFSQEDLKRFAGNPKLQPFVEPFIDVPVEEKVKKTEANLKPPVRLQQPAKHSLLGAMFSNGLGLFILLILYAASLWAGYEIAIFRAQPIGLVCGIAAVLPLVGPIIFLSMPTRIKPGEAVEAAPAEGAAAPAAAATGEAVAAGASSDDLNPLQGDGVAHPVGLRLAHIETDEKSAPSLPPTTTFQRGQFTFNRRFFETKFPGFFGVVKREADKDMVLVIKCSRGEYVGQRISRIAANDLHLQVQHGAASEEIMIPFQEIQQIQFKHKDAK